MTMPETKIDPPGPVPPADPLQLLVQGQLELDELARAVKSDLRAMGRWAMDPDNA